MLYQLVCCKTTKKKEEMSLLLTTPWLNDKFKACKFSPIPNHHIGANATLEQNKKYAAQLLDIQYEKVDSSNKLIEDIYNNVVATFAVANSQYLTCTLSDGMHQCKVYILKSALARKAVNDKFNFPNSLQRHLFAHIVELDFIITPDNQVIGLITTLANVQGTFFRYGEPEKLVRQAPVRNSPGVSLQKKKRLYYK